MLLLQYIYVINEFLFYNSLHNGTWSNWSYPAIFTIVSLLTFCMRYLLHSCFELLEERGSIPTHDPLRSADYAIFKTCWISWDFLDRFMQLDWHLIVPVDGEPVIRLLTYNWKQVWRFLGSSTAWHERSTVKSSLVAKQFTELPPDVDVVGVQRYAHVYIMQLIWVFMFAKKIKYSSPLYVSSTFKRFRLGWYILLKRCMPCMTV